MIAVAKEKSNIKLVICSGREPMACLGYEDLNDHTDLRKDTAYKLL